MNHLPLIILGGGFLVSFFYSFFYYFKAFAMFRKFMRATGQSSKVTFKAYQTLYSQDLPQTDVPFLQNMKTQFDRSLKRHRMALGFTIGINAIMVLAPGFF